MLIIVKGRNTKYAKRNAEKAREEALAKGEEVPDYFLLPKKKKGESEPMYLRRVWAANKDAVARSGGAMPADQLNYSRFKEETLSRAENGNISIEEAVRKQARAQYTPQDQITKEKNERLLTINNARAVFERMAGAKFDAKAMAYDPATSTYTYGNVKFGYKYKKGKRGQPGGLHFVIENVATGEKWTDDELAQAAADRAADLAMKREERAMRLAKLKEENPAQWMAEEAKRERRNELARKRYRRKHPKRRRGK